MIVPTRSYSSNSYRYGFQAQEKDDEIKGEGNSINYKFRMHDPRVGRFFAVDPLTSKYPWYTPYQFSGNKPIQFVELEGLEEGISAAGSITTSYTFGSKGKSHVNIGFGFSIMATGSTNIGDINAAGQASLNFSGNYGDYFIIKTATYKYLIRNRLKMS